ncbi:MAG: hypothetical protein NT027_08750 [Proteobacteria bacterium]|nr:hypothetical protein [Pseudomonadota bacterium]
MRSIYISFLLSFTVLLGGCQTTNKGNQKNSSLQKETQKTDDEFLAEADLNLQSLVKSLTPFLACRASDKNAAVGTLSPEQGISVYETEDPNNKLVLVYESHCGICDALPRVVARKVLLGNGIDGSEQTKDQMSFRVVGYYGPLEFLPPPVGSLKVRRQTGAAGLENKFAMTEDFQIRHDNAPNSLIFASGSKADFICELTSLPNLNQ